MNEAINGMLTAFGAAVLICVTVWIIIQELSRNADKAIDAWLDHPDNHRGREDQLFNLTDPTGREVADLQNAARMAFGGRDGD